MGHIPERNSRAPKLTGGGWKQLGVPLLRTPWQTRLIYCAANYFAPLYDCFHREFVLRGFAVADETRGQVLKEPGREAGTDSFMWLFRSGEAGLPPIILFKYTETRTKFNTEDFLKGFHRYLETDCYQGYNNLPAVKRCCCWAHLGRYFVDIISKGKKEDLGEPAVQSVQYCGRFFSYERRSEELDHSYEQRKKWQRQFIQWLRWQKSIA
ncbi:MAG: transposase [Eubacteriales bacterium]|nr:transposase [Eubacteriales bacterium]